MSSIISEDFNNFAKTLNENINNLTETLNEKLKILDQLQSLPIFYKHMLLKEEKNSDFLSKCSFCNYVNFDSDMIKDASDTSLCEKCYSNKTSRCDRCYNKCVTGKLIEYEPDSTAWKALDYCPKCYNNIETFCCHKCKIESNYRYYFYKNEKYCLECYEKEGLWKCITCAIVYNSKRKKERYIKVSDGLECRDCYKDRR